MSLGAAAGTTQSHMQDASDTGGSALEQEHRELQDRLADVLSDRSRINDAINEVEAQIRIAGAKKAAWWEAADAKQVELVALMEAAESKRLELRYCKEYVRKMMQVNFLNDSFHIWHAGPFVTVNGFKLGRLPFSYSTEWSEVNAALGQAMFALAVSAEQAHFKFRTYLLQPLGSCSRIFSKIDTNLRLCLFYNEEFSFFPRRNLNVGLQAFLSCLQEFGEYAEQQDPTLRLPHRIKDGTIGGLPTGFGQSSEESWTKAMKFLLTDLKWLISWTVKHVPL